MITLFIGRFQPFHNGHLFDIKNALKFSDKIIIGIGSSQESNSKDNPLSFDERKHMIENVLRANSIHDYEIIAIPDINDDERWVEHVKSIVSDFDIIYTGNERVKTLFQEKAFDVRDVTLLEGITATEIRKRMKNNESWKELVPEQVADCLQEINGIQRIRTLNGAD